MSTRGLICLEESLVIQEVDQGESAEFAKQILQVPLDPPLVMVRKTLPEGPNLGSVLLIHGLAQNRYSWHLSQRSVVNWLAQRGWDVYNLELRGHGRSRSPEFKGPECFDDYVEDLCGVLAHFERPPFVIGHSLGGAAAYAASTRGPMAGVIGLGAVFGFGGNPLLGGLCRLTHALRAAPVLELLNVRTRAIGTVLSQLFSVADLAGYALPISGWWPGSVEPELLEERLDRGFDWTSFRVWQDMSRWASTGRFDDYEEGWRSGSTPVLVLMGDRDSLATQADAERAYHESGASDRSRVLLEPYEHETHWGHLDIVLGRRASAVVWPIMHSWMRERWDSGAEEVQDPR